jgi:hypothetical protein
MSGGRKCKIKTRIKKNFRVIKMMEAELTEYNCSMGFKNIKKRKKVNPFFPKTEMNDF